MAFITIAVLLIRALALLRIDVEILRDELVGTCRCDRYCDSEKAGVRPESARFTHVFTSMRRSEGANRGATSPPSRGFVPDQPWIFDGRPLSEARNCPWRVPRLSRRRFEALSSEQAPRSRGPGSSVHPGRNHHVGSRLCPSCKRGSPRATGAHQYRVGPRAKRRDA